MELKIGDWAVRNFSRPYVIAEIGANHNGDMSLARKLIKGAKEAGCNSAKFQSWTKNALFSSTKYGDDFFQQVDEFSISEEELLEMRDCCNEYEIDFACTPFSRKEADYLADKLKVPFIKVASMDLNNYSFLEYIARKGLPVMLSTGLGTLSEISKAVQTIESTGNKKIIVLHCVANYPPKDEDVNLNNIDMLRNNYPDYPVGFSDHTLGTVIPLAAVAKGACVIEKHFTLDKDMDGWDHAISATKDEMALIVDGSKRIIDGLGTYYRSVTADDKEKVLAFRRSVVAAQDIPDGKNIELKDLDCKRPGTGIEPQYVDMIVGKKAKRKISYDELLSFDDF